MDGFIISKVEKILIARGISLQSFGKALEAIKGLLKEIKDTKLGLAVKFRIIKGIYRTLKDDRLVQCTGCPIFDNFRGYLGFYQRLKTQNHRI